ncbi:MAG: PBP1A family penicillin-binding protein [Deltaproteobacteria bacterium]|nr:PBP1A family penicillin-binding protein [Deltaproteobacteria bacterium]
MRPLKILLVFLAICLVSGVGLYYYFTRDLPPLDSLQDYNPNLVTKVWSHDGQLIGEFYIERRIVVPLEKMPRHLVKAFLAAEDAKFFEHEGISYSSIFRALYKNLLAGKVVQGGSTITQQVAKSFFLTPERKLSRKVREAVMAYRIEKNLNKEEILNLYLNQIYFGNGNYGIQTASEAYFGKDVEELDIAESALLAGLPKAPSKYSPFASFELSKRRQEFIIDRMVEEKFISAEEGDRAIKKELVIRPRTVDSIWVGPYFTEHVRRYLEDKYGTDILYRRGLDVHTTLDVGMQRAANEAVTEGLREYDRRRGYRGPVGSLKTREEIDAFRAASDKGLSGAPLSPGATYRGVVTALNTKKNSLSLSVDIGSLHGLVESQDLEWTRLYNPTKEPDGGKREDIKKIFHPGDVVEVEVKGFPDKMTGVYPLKISQEPRAQASLLAMEPETGAIRAMVGGADFGKSQFNRTVQALRQPGSSFKPIIYTAALDRDYTPATIVIDSPIVFEETRDEEEKKEPQKTTDPNGAPSVEDEQKWRPRNYDEQFKGPTTVREALAKSRNIITIKILKDIGMDQAIKYARMLGVTSPLSRDLSLALGSSAVTLMEMTTVFATLDNMGVRPDPMFITRITDRDGRVLEENKPFTTTVLSPQTAYIVTSLLQGVVEHGTGVRAKALGRPAAGKTGTTNNLNDAWFIGYVPGLTAGAWLGYDDEKPLGHKETGSRAALPIWLRFMQKALVEKPVKGFTAPDGLEFTKIDPYNGLLAGPATEDPVFEVFKSGTAPTEVSTARIKRTTDFFMMDSDSERPVEKKTETGDEEEPLD